MQYQKINNIVFRGLKVLIALLTLAMDLLISMMKFLAEATRITADENNSCASDNLTGGVLNYRTGKLDDGTDPIGWYEKD